MTPFTGNVQQRQIQKQETRGGRGWGSRVSFRVMKSSGSRQWWRLYNTVSVFNVTELYALKA